MSSNGPPAVPGSGSAASWTTAAASPRYAAGTGASARPTAWNGAASCASARTPRPSYEPYWKLALQKAALEFSQEFLLEFAANIAVNGIVDAIAGTQFNGKDVLKAFANAAVGAP